MTITQTVVFDGLTNAMLTNSVTGPKYKACYAFALGLASSCTGSINSKATVSVAIASRRTKVSAKYMVKYLCPAPATAACKANVAALGSQSTKLTKAYLVSKFGGAGLRNIESVLAASVSVSSASSTSIMAMMSVVAMLAGLFWQ